MRRTPDSLDPKWLRIYLLQALVRVARLASRGARRLVDRAKQPGSIPLRLAILLSARVLLGIAEGASWLFEKVMPRV